MSGNPGAPYKPGTPEQLEELRTNVFPSLPTFSAADHSIAASDVPKMCKVWKWEGNDARVSSYQTLISNHYGGRIQFDVLARILGAYHKSSDWLREYVSASDFNNDGFIQKDEYEFFFHLFKLHYPDALNKTYEEFVKEADVNADGKVSIEEAVAWQAKQSSA